MSKSGGSNTTKNGKEFEKKTNNEVHLRKIGYITYFFPNSNKTYTCKKYDDKIITFLPQGSLAEYVKKFNVKLFRYPDDAYIIEKTNGEIELFIIEKKNQSTEGSVETKLWASPSLKREYELVSNKKIKIHYILCINTFLFTKINSNVDKYKYLSIILNENDIPILNGDDPEYFNKIKSIINFD